MLNLPHASETEAPASPHIATLWAVFQCLVEVSQGILVATEAVDEEASSVVGQTAPWGETDGYAKVLQRLFCSTRGQY